MKKHLLKTLLTALVLLTGWGSSAWAESDEITVTYDFTSYAARTLSNSGTRAFNANSVNHNYASNLPEVYNRFAFQFAGTFSIENAGLYAQRSNGDHVGIVGLAAGDKVTINFSQGAIMIRGAVPAWAGITNAWASYTTGTEITTSVAGNLSFQAKSSCKISSIVIKTTAAETVTAPIISSEANGSGRLVTLTDGGSSLMSGVTTYYTTDGTAPTTSSTKYVEPFVITETTTIKAITISNSSAATSSTVSTEVIDMDAIDVPTAAITAVDGISRTVSFSCATEGVTLYYSTDNGENYTEGTSLVISANTNIKVKATKGSASSESENLEFEAGTTVLLNAPTYSIGAYSDGGYSLTLSSDQSSTLLTPEATISYTINDGAEISVSSGTAVQVPVDSEIKLWSVYSGYTNSAVVAATPTYINLDDYDVTWSTDFKSLAAEIQPNTNSSATLTLGTEELVTGYYNIINTGFNENFGVNNVAWQVRNQGSGKDYNTGLWPYNVNGTMAITNLSAGAVVVFTSDQAVTAKENATKDVFMSTANNNYTFVVNNEGTAEFSATKSSYIYSVVVYETIPPLSVATPTFSVPAGEYSEAQTVTLACETEGAAIYYTIDGTEPTAESTPYSEDISISETTTVKAIAVLGDVVSEVAEATYTINLPFNPSTAIANPSFEADGVITASNASLTITGWTQSDPTNKYNNTGCYTTTDNIPTQGTVSVTPSDGTYFLYFRKGWAQNTYTFTSDKATMPAGAYTLSVDYKMVEGYDDKQNNTSSVTILAKSGEDVLGSEDGKVKTNISGGNAYSYLNTAEWSTVTAKFILEEETDVNVVISLFAGGQRRTDFCLDNVRLTYKSVEEAAAEELAAAKEALDAEIEKAEGYKTEARTAGLTDYEEAIAAAEAAKASTTANEISQAIAALQAAETTFLTANLPVAEGTYYVINPMTGKFLGRGNAWGTSAVVGDYGVAVNVACVNLPDGKYTLTNFDNGITFGDDTWMFADASGNRARSYIINKVDGGYTMTNTGNNQLVYVYLNDGGDKYRVAGNANKGDNYTDDAQTVWDFITPDEYNSLIAARNASEKTAAFESAGIDENAELMEGESVELTFATGHSWTQTVVRAQDNQPKTNDNGTEMWQATGYYTQTVSELPSGLYKVSIQAFYRNGSPEECVTRYNTGYNTVLAYLDANGSKVQVKSWATDKGNGNDPNTMDQAKAKFADKKYISETYAYVGEDGKLNLAVYNPAHIGNGWFIAGNVTYTPISPATTVTLAVTDAQYATFVAPFDVTIPDGVTAYTVDAVTDNELTMTAVETTIVANTPVVLFSETVVEEEVSGVANPVETPTAGLLTGVYTDTPAIEGTYILQKQDAVAFFKVETAGITTVKANHAYLTAPASGARAYYFGGEATAIGALKALTGGDAEIYDVNGRKQVKLQKGVNIIRTKDGRTQKVMVK